MYGTGFDRVEAYRGIRGQYRVHGPTKHVAGLRADGLNGPQHVSWVVSMLCTSRTTYLIVTADKDLDIWTSFDDGLVMPRQGVF